MEKLSKKEKKLLKKEEFESQLAREERNKAIKKWTIITVIVVLLVAGLWWVIKESNKPLPGQTVDDLGRTHVKIGEKIKYNSNPPTSGSHYPEWTKAGIYDAPKQDEYLVHSLEHGYIIISYNCEKLSARSFWGIARGFIPQTYAQEPSMNQPTASTESMPTVEASPEAKLTDPKWNSKACNDIKNQLKAITDEKRIWKMIVIPRPNLDTTIALTAWDRIDKMDSVKKEEINSFIDAFRDKGPEQTMEP
jgi:hypothetical protein